jgi:hypothetical protein
MSLYAITFQNSVLAWTEFYWAEDVDHAGEQAQDAHPGERIACVASVPAVYLRTEPWHTAEAARS